MTPLTREEKGNLLLAGALYDFFEELRDKDKEPAIVGNKIKEKYLFPPPEKDYFKEVIRRTHYAKRFVSVLEDTLGSDSGTIEPNELKEWMGMRKELPIQFYPEGFFIRAEMENWPDDIFSLGLYLRNIFFDPLKTGQWKDGKIEGVSNLIVFLPQTDYFENNVVDVLRKESEVKEAASKLDTNTYKNISVSLLKKSSLEHEKRHLIDYILGVGDNPFSELPPILFESSWLPHEPKQIVERSLQDNVSKRDRKRITKFLERTPKVFYPQISYLVSVMLLRRGPSELGRSLLKLSKKDFYG